MKHSHSITPRTAPVSVIRIPWSMGGVGLVLCVLQLAFSLSVNAQTNYTIDWYTIDGGGGTSTGGVYAVSGTIGQPDASTTPLTNGQYAVVGGFWALPQAIQTPGSPLLSIEAAGPGLATISWTPNTPGFVLQQTISLNPANWADAASGSTNPVTVTLSGGMTYYRLNKP